MPDSRIFQLKLAMEEDGQLSHGARTLGLRVCSHVHNHWRTIVADEPFPLPWTLCSKLCWGMSQREVYRCLRELVDCGHFRHEGAKGCPNVAQFRLVLPCHSSAQAGRTGNAQAGRTSSVKYDSTGSAQKSSPHTNTFPSEEIIDSNGSNSSPGGINGSLRSKRTQGDELALPPAAKKGTKATAIGETQRLALSQLKADLKKQKTGKLL